MRARISILTFGVSLLGLPAAPARTPPPVPQNLEYYPPYLAPDLATLLLPGGFTPLDTLTAPPPSHPSQRTPPQDQAAPPPVMPSAAAPSSLTWTYSAPAAPVKPQTRVYAVADLVGAPLAIPGAAALENTAKAHAHTLMKMIVALTKPESWERGGGRGTVQFIAASDSLCVTNAPEVLAEVEKLLAGLRRMQDAQVCLEVHLVTVPAGFGAKAGWPGDRGSKCLTPAEAKKTLEALTAEKAAETIARPKITLFDGQPGSFQVGNYLPNRLSERADKGPELIIRANAELVFIGTTLTCAPTIAMDGKSVVLKMSTEQTFPNLTPTVLEKGRIDIAFDTVSNDCKMILTDGSSAILHVGTRDAERKVEQKLFPRMPYLGRVFSTVAIKTEKQEVYQMVTVRIIRDGADSKTACAGGPGVVAPAACVVPAGSIAPAIGIAAAPKPTAAVASLDRAAGWIGGR